MRKKCASEHRIFNSSPIFEISLNAALLNTLRYPYNTLEHRRNAFLVGAKISELPSKYGKASSTASEFADARFAASAIIIVYMSTIIAYVNNMPFTGFEAVDRNLNNWCYYKRWKMYTDHKIVNVLQFTWQGQWNVHRSKAHDKEGTMPVSYVCIIPQIDSRDWSTITTEVTIWECTEATRYSLHLQFTWQGRNNACSVHAM